MSIESTLHFACDACGKRADVKAGPGILNYPEGWRSLPIDPYSDVCSEPCARAILVSRALAKATRLFEPAPVPAAVTTEVK